ncbi:pentapeptide repeat-containing protein [Hyalangium minutum]|nr:pentapeptide repeat-containing protein [Hyalangium minutum]
MSESHVDVLIVTALKEELDAVLELRFDGRGRDGWTSARDPHGFPYSWRTLPNQQGENLHVAAAWSGDMGETAAAARSIALIQQLNPACIAMSGICAGRRGKVSLGDVIVADRIFSYDHGKLVAAHEGHGADLFHDITTYNLDPAWRMDAAFFAEEFTQAPGLEKTRPLSLEAQQRWFLRALETHERGAAPAPNEHPDWRSQCPDLASCIRALRKSGLIDPTPGKLQLTEKGRGLAAEERLIDPDGKRTDGPFRVHVAPIATGKTVQEDPELFERLSRHVRKVLGAEMEATAMGFVAEQLGRRLLIAKAVSDYADHDKDDAFRDFACHASASFLLAFLRKHQRPHPSASASGSSVKESRPPALRRAREDRRQDEFLARVEQVCALRHAPGTQIKRKLFDEAPAPFNELLEVTMSEGGVIQSLPVAALEQPLTAELLTAFLDSIHAEYRKREPTVISTLVHSGPSAPEALLRQARAQQVRLISFSEYQGLYDFSSYLQWQTTRLENDPIYPPSLYVEQQGQVSIGGGAPERTQDVLQKLLEVLNSPHTRFALILGDFGAGKTFLLHELARRMAPEKALVPVLIEMRSLQKHVSLKQLIAQHFAAADLGRLEPDKFLYLLRSGRIALLFDGFDELALRVTYDQVMEHFNTIIEAVQGDAKVVITSRTQHFLTDQQVKRQLGERAALLPGYRLIELERFSEQQVWRFLKQKLGNPAAADERMKLLKGIDDLLSLAENPRMLSFIAELEESTLREALAKSGKLTKAHIYKVLIQRWIDGEVRRIHPSGALKGLDQRQIFRGATELALLLWERTDRFVDMRELPAAILEAVNAYGQHKLDREVIRHQLGSGSLMVRDAEGRFSFIHQSIMEWFVAAEAAQEIHHSKAPTVLGRREMSELMAEFFVTLSQPELARRWAEAKAASAESDILRGNALKVLRQFSKLQLEPRASTGATPSRNLERSDLHGQDLSGEDLRRANLSRANLSGATLVNANLVEARLGQANLKRANLGQAVLRGADLAGADLTGARLLGADLRGARLQGASLHGAKLVGARLDSLEDLRLFGAALPVPKNITPTLGLASPLRAVVFSPAGEYLATAHADGTVRLWDAETGHCQRVFEGHLDASSGLAFSRDGRLLASGTDAGAVILWSVEQLRPLHTLLGHKQGVTGVAFSPDSLLLASSSLDGTLILWSVEEGRSVRPLEGHKGAVLSVAFSPDGKTVASGSDDRTLTLWHAHQGRPLHTLSGHWGSILSLAFSPDGRLLASGSEDKTVILWNVEDAKPLRMLEGHAEAIRSVTFSPDGRTLASGSEDKSTILWSIKQAMALTSLKSHTGPVWSVAFSPDGKTLASGSDDKTVILWSVEHAKPLRALQDHSSAVRSVAFSADGRIHAQGFEDGTLILWSVPQARLLRLLQGHTESISSIAISPDGKTLASATQGGRILLWSVEHARPLSTLQGHREAVLSMAFSPDGKTLVSGSKDQTLSFWNVSVGTQLRSRQLHRGSVTTVAFSPDGKTLASGSDDRNILLWSAEQGTYQRTLRGHSGPVRSITFSPDGTTLASGSDEEPLLLWSTDQGRILRTFSGTSGFTLSVAFSPDGKALASGSDSGALVLWSVEKGSRLRTFPGNRGSVLHVAFGPEGAWLSSASDDGTARYWESATGRPLATFLGHLDGCVAFRPDGHFKSGGDVTGIFWHAVSLCRFEPGELDPYLPTPLRLTDKDPLFTKA